MLTQVSKTSTGISRLVDFEYFRAAFIGELRWTSHTCSYVWHALCDSSCWERSLESGQNQSVHTSIEKYSLSINRQPEVYSPNLPIWLRCYWNHLLPWCLVISMLAGTASITGPPKCEQEQRAGWKHLGAGMNFLCSNIRKWEHVVHSFDGPLGFPLVEWRALRNDGSIDRNHDVSNILTGWNSPSSKFAKNGYVQVLSLFNWVLQMLLIITLSHNLIVWCFSWLSWSFMVNLQGDWSLLHGNAGRISRIVSYQGGPSPFPFLLTKKISPLTISMHTAVGRM
jgi:hypothetical protein